MTKRKMIKVNSIFFVCFLLLSCSNNTTDTTKKDTLTNHSNNKFKLDSINKSTQHLNIDSTHQTCKDLAKLTDGVETNKASISLKDSSFIVGHDKFHDHQIFGYERPDTTSKKLLLILMMFKAILTSVSMEHITQQTV
jgi:hypothetical protein